MPLFYADNGLLTDDPDAVMAARWVAYQCLPVWRSALGLQTLQWSSTGNTL